MTHKPIYIILFLFGSLISFGQTVGDLVDVNKDNISPWKTDKEKYYGTYSFGFSENESELRIFGNDTITVAQHQYRSWNENGWHRNFRTFTNVKIIGSTFYSDQYNGEFINFKTYDAGEVLQGLHIDSYITIQYGGVKGSEIGSKNKKTIKGKYPEASTQILSYEHLRDLKLKELKIIRNEIFARYSYTFKKGGKMDTYFSNQTWYYGQNNSIQEFLTLIEQENIVRIKQIEKEK